MEGARARSAVHERPHAKNKQPGHLQAHAGRRNSSVAKPPPPLLGRRRPPNSHLYLHKFLILLSIS
jgi:hypothetical protein